MATRLKVFTWSDGFHAFTVAASSRPKALKAWGVDQDLFKTGLAHEAEDGPDHNAALASPGAVIARSLAEDLVKAVPRKHRPANAGAKARLKALEAEMDTLDSRQAEAIKALETRQAELNRMRADLQAQHEEARGTLAARIEEARSAAR